MNGADDFPEDLAAAPTPGSDGNGTEAAPSQKGEPLSGPIGEEPSTGKATPLREKVSSWSSAVVATHDLSSGAQSQPSTAMAPPLRSSSVTGIAPGREVSSAARPATAAYDLPAMAQTQASTMIASPLAAVSPRRRSSRSVPVVKSPRSSPVVPAPAGPPPQESNSEGVTNTSDRKGVITAMAAGEGVKAPPPRVATNQIHAPDGRIIQISPPVQNAGVTGGILKVVPVSVASGGGGSLPPGALTGGGDSPVRRASQFRENKGDDPLAPSAAPVPRGLTGELMRNVAALDVTRMSCDQVSEWYESEDSGKKMQHRVQNVNGKELVGALHGAPEDIASWLDPARVDGNALECTKDDRFQSLREEFVTTLAEKSGALAEIEALKLARKINHHKQVWSATWKLVARGCSQGVLELKCLVRTLLWRLGTNGPSATAENLSVFADYLRFLLVPSQVYAVTGTAVAKTLSGSLEAVLKKTNSGPLNESSERYLQSLVGVLCALCPVGDSRDTSSTSEVGRRLGDVGIVALPVLCPGLARLRQMQTRCAVSSFLANLSWHDDNKIQMYQTEEVVPRVLLVWLCDEEMKKQAKGDKYVAFARLNMATVIWNLSKRSDNASGLVQPEIFDLLFDLLRRRSEQGEVLRRIVSCVHNLASIRRCSSDLTDLIATDRSVSNVLGVLFGLLARGGAKNMHQRVLGTFANIAYLCVSGDASTEWAGHLRETLKRFLSRFTETTDVLGSFDLDPLEAQDRQLKFQGVRFEIARFLWCMIRLDLCHGASVKRLAAYISELDILGASAGVFYENVPRASLKHHEVVDLLQCAATTYEADTRGIEERRQHDEAGPWNGNTERSGQERADTIRSFALWMLAHYTGRPDDRVQVASHGGLTVLASILMGKNGLVEAAKQQSEPSSRQTFINLKLAAKSLANLCQAPQTAELVEPAGALAAIEALYSFVAKSPSFQRAQEGCIPARYRINPNYRKTYLVVQNNLWRPTMKASVTHRDGSVTVHYEVPAGYNEKLQLSRRITPVELERKELQILEGEVPHQIDILAEVAAGLSALALHSSVLKLFPPSGVLGPFLQLSLDGLIPRETCFAALLDTPVTAYSQRVEVMRHLWNVMSSTVLEPEQRCPGESAKEDDEDSHGKHGGGDGGSTLSLESTDTGTSSSNDDTDSSVAPSENERPTAADSMDTSISPGEDKHEVERVEWSRKMVERKVQQALAVRVLDRLVAGADEDAFEPGKGGANARIGGGSNVIKRPGATASADGMERRLSEEYRRQSVLMTSGRAYTISGILSHQILLSGIIALASPTGGSRHKWKRLPVDIASPIESAQTRLEYFCIGLAGSLSDAVRRNWLALNEDRRNARNVMTSLCNLCVEHIGVLVTKAEVAARAAYIGYSQHDLDDTRSQSTVPTDGDAGAVNNAKSVHSPGHRSTSVGLNSDKMSPAAVLSPNLAMSPTAGEAASIGARDRRRAGGGGSVAKSLDRWGSNSLDSDENWSEIADAVVRGSSNGIEAFLLPEEEQVVQMLFRAVLSLLDFPEGFTPEHRMDGTRKPRSKNDVSSELRKNRWGSLNGISMPPQSSLDTQGEHGEKRPTERLDEILRLCCRLVRCGPGDAVLHVSLLAIGKILSASRQNVNSSVLEGVVPAVAGFLGRPSLWVKNACLILLHRMVTRNDLSTVVGLGRGSRPRQVVACLASTDHGIRIAAAELVRALAKDVFCSKSIVFPEALTNDDGSPTVRALRRSLGQQQSSEWGSDPGGEMDGDFDVCQRSKDGCVPPLLAMARRGWNNAERESSMVEQEVALCVLECLASANNLCREAIVVHGGVPVLLHAAETCSATARRAVAGLMAELSINPSQRVALKQAGGLLVLLQFQRSKDIDERTQAELALKNFGSDALSIHLSIARASMEVVQTLFFQDRYSTVGQGLLRPIHGRQLREAGEGLAACAMHKTSAASILSGGGLSMMLDMLRIRDFDVQYSCTRALLHLIRHNGEHFSKAMGEGDRASVILQLTCLVRPIRQRAAWVIQTRLKEVRARRRAKSHNKKHPQPPPQGLHHHKPSEGQTSSSVGVGERVLSPIRGAMSPKPDVEILRQTSDGKLNTRGPRERQAGGTEPYLRSQGCVALALNGDVAELARLASQCLELLASQSVTAVNDILSHDVIESLTSQLHTYVTSQLHLDRAQTEWAERRADGTSAIRHGSSRENMINVSSSRLQRQCIAALSSLALNSTCPVMRPARREAVERALLFLASFHWQKSVRGEATLALRRFQSRMNLPHPTSWGVLDCMKWISCVNLDGMCAAAELFLSDGGPTYETSPRARNRPRTDKNNTHFQYWPSTNISRHAWGTQGSELSAGSGTEQAPSPNRHNDKLGGTKNASGPHGARQENGGEKVAAIGKPGSDEPLDLNHGRARGRPGSDDFLPLGRSGRSGCRSEIGGGEGTRQMITAGSRLLQATRTDLLSYPFNASPEAASKFLRNLRTLKLHASATSAMNQHGRQPHVAGVCIEPPGRSQPDSERGAALDPGDGVSEWQERKHTLMKIEHLLEQNHRNAEGIVVAETNWSAGMATSNMVEATDRFGSVLTLRLVRQCGVGATTSSAFNKTPASKIIATTRGGLHSDDLHNQDGNQASHRQVLQTTYPTPISNGTAINRTIAEHDDGGRNRASADRVFRTSGSRGHVTSGVTQNRGGARIAPLGTVDARTDMAAETEGDKTNASPGLKLLGGIVDEAGGDVLEIYQSSFHQQALVSEARRVLCQPRNRDLRVALMTDVAAVGVGRNSIGAVLMTSRPYKKVTLEMTASLTERESPDPEGYISTTLAVIQDSTGVSHLFVLDLCDTANTQDPRDGRTSLMTAVLDNDETLVGRLLAERVDIAITDTQGRTALLHSVIRKHDGITDLILAHHSALVRSRLNERNNSKRWGRSSSGNRGGGEDAGMGEGSGVPEAVSDLQAMLDQRDYTGKAALHHAVADMEERHTVVQALLAAKAQVNIRDAMGNSPLHIACQYGHVHTVKTLIQYNANSGSRNDELVTPIHIASLNLRIKILSVLLKENQGSMVTAEDARGWTALHYACRTIAQAKRSDSTTDQSLVKEKAEEVVQQLLRHGADLHNLDKCASKPLDFRKYFEERRDDIMEGVKATLEYKVASANQIWASARSLPQRAVKALNGTSNAWHGSSAQAKELLVFHQSKQRFQAGSRLFSSARVQEAVNEEWIKGGHRTRAVRILMLFCVYLGVFTSSAVLNSGRNRPHGFHLTMSVQTALESGSDLWNDEGASLGTVTTVENIWEWLQGPVIDLIYADRNASWYDQGSVIEADGWSGLRVLGTSRLSQWRTSSHSCKVWPDIGPELDKFCFADYCGEDWSGRPMCDGAARDDFSYGRSLEYTYVPGAHSHPIDGSFGMYGPGAFVQHITQESRPNATTTLEELERKGWIDEATRALALEIHLHSFSARKLMYVRILVELPAEGGVPLTHPLYNTFNTFNSFEVLRGMVLGKNRDVVWSQLGSDGGGMLGDRMTFQIDVALLLLVLVNLAKEVLELRRQGPYYFLAVANIVDVLLIVGHATIFGLDIGIANALADLQIQAGDQYVDLRPAAELVTDKRQLVATMILLVWIKLMNPLQAVFQDFFLLVKMIALMIGKLVKSFLPLLGIIYVAWAFARYTLLGQLESLMQSVASTLATQYPETLGEFTFDDIRKQELHQTWRYAFTALFTLLVVVVMLNLLVSLLNDLYEELKALAKADWCRAQATSIYMNSRWHRVQGRDSRQQRSGGKTDGGKHLSRQSRWDEDDEGPLPPRERLRAKVVALGQEHLELFVDKEIPKEVHSVTLSLEDWNRKAAHATLKGSASPLPPIEDLRNLHDMVKENNYEVIWTLLKGDILKALADVIGADGRPFINDDITANTPWADESQRSPRPAHHQRASPQATPEAAHRRSLVEVLHDTFARAWRWLRWLTASFSSSAMERRQHWNEARRLAVTIARMLAESPYSDSQTKKSRGNDNNGSWKTDKIHSNNSVDVNGHLGKPRSHLTSQISGGRARINSAVSGDEILRKLGGGYLVVATLCTLERALSVDLSVRGGRSSEGSGQSQRIGTQDKREQQQQTPLPISVKNIEAAREIKELLLLLNSLLRLGSTMPTVGDSGMPGDASHRARGNLNPPLISEVDSALTAAGPTSRRRRVSVDYEVNLSHQTSYAASGRISGHRKRSSALSHGSAVHVAAAKGPEVSGVSPTSLASNLVSPLMRPKGAAAAPTYPSRNGKKAIPWSEPRRPSIDSSSAYTSVGTSLRSGYSSTYGERGGSISRLSTIDANETLYSGAVSKSALQRSLSSSPRFAPEIMGSITAGRTSTSVEGVSRVPGVSMHGGTSAQRVPRSEFETCGGGNFAVLLATRWKRGGNDDEERCGFTLLARLALGGSLCPPVGQSPKETLWWWNVGRSSSGVYPKAGTNEDKGGAWWRKDDRRRGDGGWSNTRPERTTKKVWQKRRPGKSAKEGVWAMDWNEGAEEQQPTKQVVVLATEITRDYFLSQVTAMLEGGLAGCPHSSTYLGGDEFRSSRSYNNPVRRWIRRHSGGEESSPFNELLPQPERSARFGAALAHQVAVLGSDGPRVLVAAGMLVHLARVAALKTDETPGGYALGPSARKIAIACLTEIILQCDIEDNRTPPLPETGETIPGEALGEELVITAEKRVSEGSGFDGGHSPSGSKLSSKEVLGLACTFMDIMVEGFRSLENARSDGDSGQDLAEMATTALGLLLSVCENHDWELNTSGQDSHGTVGDIYDRVVDTIRCHRGFRDLEHASGGTDLWRRDGSSPHQPETDQTRDTTIESRRRQWWRRKRDQRINISTSINADNHSSHQPGCGAESCSHHEVDTSTAGHKYVVSPKQSTPPRSVFHRQIDPNRAQAARHIRRLVDLAPSVRHPISVVNEGSS